MVKLVNYGRIAISDAFRKGLTITGKFIVLDFAFISRSGNFLACREK